MTSSESTTVSQVRLNDLLCADNFLTWHKTEDDHLVGMKLEDGGQITVLDRVTGWSGGSRDIESGYKDKDGKFWLASCQFDIREQGPITVAEAIAIIKEYANTCTGD